MYSQASCRRNGYRNEESEDNGKEKGKVLPRTGHEDPEAEQISSTLPSTSALDVGR